MPRETWTARQGSSVTRDPAPGGVRSAQTCLFRKEGEYWTVGYLWKPVRLRDAKGLRYIAHLLRYPAAEFHVLDLAGGIASGRDEDETTRSMQDLPRTEEDLEKAG